jgi:outer membrane protein assembly factor BamD
MSAYAYYLIDSYDDAIPALERFIDLHPGNRGAAYAYYLRALCYYEQIADVNRDQGNTEEAQRALSDVIARFPNTPYARDATLKLDLVRDHLAGKEMAVGRYYQERGQYLAAINRYKTVVDQYQTTTHVPEALERLTEAYVALGIFSEAEHTASVLGYNYPGSEWYQSAFTLLTDKGVSMQDAELPPVVKNPEAVPAGPPPPEPQPDQTDQPNGLPPAPQASAPQLPQVPSPDMPPAPPAVPTPPVDEQQVPSMPPVPSPGGGSASTGGSTPAPDTGTGSTPDTTSGSGSGGFGPPIEANPY